MRFISKTLVAIAALSIGAVAFAQTLDLPADPVSVSRTADGAELRQYNVRVHRVSRNHITVRFDNGEFATYRVPRGFQFMIEGEPTPLSAIRPRQELRVHIERRDDQWRLAQAREAQAEPGVMVVVLAAPRVSEEAHEEDAAAALPATASGLPLFALGGTLMLGLGLLLRVGSRRFSRG